MANHQPDHPRHQQPHPAAPWLAVTDLPGKLHPALRRRPIRRACRPAVGCMPKQALGNRAARTPACWRCCPEATTAAVPPGQPPAHDAADPSFDRPAGREEQHVSGGDRPALPGWQRPLPQPDPRPSYYYVGVADELRSPTRYALLAGPFGTHPPALEMVDPARQAAGELDPWAGFYAFGTCQTPEHRGPGRLNPQLGLVTGPDGLVTRPTPEVGEDQP